MRLILLLLCSLGWQLSEQPTATFDPHQGLVAHYTFNDCAATDITGNGSHGRLMGNVNCWCGIEGDGLLFDGRNGYVVLDGPVNDVFSTTDFTISFYVKVEGQSAFPQTVLSKRLACDDDHVLELAVNTATQELQTDFKESEFKYFRELSPPLPEGSWLHYTLVREGVRAHTYINGLYRRSSFKCSGVDISNAAMLKISDSPCVRSGRARPFKGVIDELRVYDRALTEEEVRLLYELHPIENVAMDCAT